MSKGNLCDTPVTAKNSIVNDINTLAGKLEDIERLFVDLRDNYISLILREDVAPDGGCAATCRPEPVRSTISYRITSIQDHAERLKRMIEDTIERADVS